jgi:hypothetical protein
MSSEQNIDVIVVVSGQPHRVLAAVSRDDVALAAEIAGLDPVRVVEENVGLRAR